MEFIKLNVNMDMIIKNAERMELNTKIVSAVLITQLFKMILIQYKCFCCNRNYQIKFNENFKKRFAYTYNFF